MSNNIETSGGIFTHHFIDSIEQERVGHPALKADTFIYPYQDRISERDLEARIASSWADLVERWDVIEREFYSLDLTALRNRWLRPLFSQLGFNLEFNRSDIVLENEFRFPISFLGRAGTTQFTVPVHSVLYRPDQTLETKSIAGRGIKAMAPHDMLQRYLNLSKEHKWGILTDGVNLRLLRDYYHSYTRGYTEFDLQSIFGTRDYAGFRAMFRLLHASRFVIPEGKENSPIEEMYEDALAMGVAVGNKLRENVQAAIETFANGFLVSSPRFLAQVNALPEGSQQLYRDILVTIYRILFLLFAEQRGMLPGRGSLYHDEFSLTAFRTLAEQPRSEDNNIDLWEKLKASFSMVEHGVKDLNIFPYNGALFSMARTPLLTPSLAADAPLCRNDFFLTAIRHLTTVEQDGVLQRISYSDLSVEEIGSIYESLLEITPRISESTLLVDNREILPNTFFLDPRGKGRKTSGSYYTPPSLVNELIKSALEPVLLSRLQSSVPGYDPELVEALSDEERQLSENALLHIKVVDPACGSGAFLIAANNKLGLELARIRSGSIFPPQKVIQRARRDVLAHCIHGVDLNPMAVELCKVSLWINAAVEDAPLNFLDHHIQCGNSLVGASPDLIKKGVPDEAFNPVTGDDKTLASSIKKRNRLARQGQDALPYKMAYIPDHAALQRWIKARDLVETAPALAEKEFTAYQTSEEKWQARLPFDLWCAAFFVPLKPGQPIPTTQDVRQASIDPRLVPTDMKQLARQLAEEHRFFHWHLAFPEVFDKEGQGGFDVVLGNPPWERPEVQDDLFFEMYIPGIKDTANASIRKKAINDLFKSSPIIRTLYELELKSFACLSKFIRYSNLFPLTSSGKYNYYALFGELAITKSNPLGLCGLILQTGIATDDPNKLFFSTISQNKNIVSLFDFENKKKIFPSVDSRYRFCLLTISKNEKFEFPLYAFMLRSVEEISYSDRLSVISWPEIFKLKPNTGTLPIFINKIEFDLARKIYSQIPILSNEISKKNPWNFEVTRIFNIGVPKVSDEIKGLDYFEKSLDNIQGNFWVSKSKVIYLPIYEAKLMNQYNHRFSSYKDLNRTEIIKGNSVTIINDNLIKANFLVFPRSWLPNTMLETTTGQKIFKKNWLLSYRDITNANNERTMIACILPKSAPDFTLRVVTSEISALLICNLLSNLNSFVFDFFVRQSMTGTHLSDYIVKQIPTLPPSIFTLRLQFYISVRVLELIFTSWDLIAFAQEIWGGCDLNLQEHLYNSWSNNKEKFGNNVSTIQVPDWIYLIYPDLLSNSLFPLSPFIWDDEHRFQLRCDLDALFGHLYNLTRDEFDYILETFPIVKRNDEAQYGEYRTKRVILEKFDAMAEDPMLEGACIPLKDRVSVLKNPPQALPQSQVQPKLKLQSKPVQAAPSAPVISQPKPAPQKPTPQPQIKEDQPALFEVSAEEQAAAPQKLSDYSLYRCPLCDKTLVGFALEAHTREVHQGKDPGYRKIK